MNRLDTFPTNEMISQYRKVFSSNHGLEVLAHMLFELGFMIPSNNEQEEILKMYGERLLAILAGGEPGKETLQKFMLGLMRQTLTEVKTEEF